MLPILALLSFWINLDCLNQLSGKDLFYNLNLSNQVTMNRIVDEPDTNDRENIGDLTQDKLVNNGGST